jgi:hypothetical protein
MTPIRMTVPDGFLMLRFIVHKAARQVERHPLRIKRFIL